MSSFRTIEFSDPLFERDHLRFITVKTKNLRGRADVAVFVPQGIETLTGCPVTILLHGVYGSAWCWPLKTGVHITAMQMIRDGILPPMVIAMPSDGLWGDGSAYLPHHQLDFEKWIAEDIPALLKQSVPGVSNASPFFIAGLSMGGFGALRIGVKYHHVFRAAAGHSSITSLSQMALFAEESLDNYKQVDEEDEDVWKTILRHRDHLPAIRFDCGDKDELIEYNRLLHQQLEQLHIPHIYEEHPGGHEWPYWQKHILDTLRFFARLI